jgi:GxxExxY protein
MNSPMQPPSDALTARTIHAIIQVHQALGPGFLESIYHRALRIELRHQGLRADVEREVTIRYRGEVVGRHRLDIVVEDSLIVELKTVQSLGRTHYAQVRSYLAATGLELGLLVNFSEHKADFRRVQGRGEWARDGTATQHNSDNGDRG